MAEDLMPQLEGSIMPHAKFMQDLYFYALARYQLASCYVKDKVVLDAGCGAGYGAEALAKAGAKKVFGVDIAPNSIQYCRENYSRQNLTFKIGDAARLDFRDNFFDLIVAFETIEHIKDYRQAISEFYRVLKPGGKLIISTPNKAVYSPGTKKPFYPFHFHEFYLEELQKMLEPFQIEKIQGQYIKGKQMMIYGDWDPRRILRIIFANLPFAIKRAITRLYLRFYFWLYRKKIYKPSKIKISDVYFSDNLGQTRIFVVLCQKPEGKK